MKSLKESLKRLGIELENKYMIIRTEEKTLVVPYKHIRTIELKGNKVVILTGGIERITVDMSSSEMAVSLLEELLVYLERVYL
ncbi:MAG: hypothetical protein N3D14_02085 [Aquificaceae bacterium]|nr:hypothetical protein [Aquificaceae bacterium]MCX8164168.1 hypothetical protein [Aquificaceae bacterium]